ncbi:hypothetical protein JRQ81_008689 [Phrynocephalus forsythii]|uniref:Uncharacterized protein n=1 Tax=Phrynocephalus forsythii TaxID=171643 RepID=A0A9Q0XB27_9SAUR|nr:hypothetical protein JRQ81_008689 [Phrynocephalus forsythii]
MEKEGEGPGDDGSREEAPPLPEAGSILRYEEHITGLMVTVARLHGRLEGLRHPRGQGRGSREEEDDDNEVSDFCSEYTASLPRGGLLPFPGPILALPPPPPPPSLGASTPDLFFAVDEAVSSLEKTVLSHKGRIPSAEAELEVTSRRPRAWKKP